MLPLFFCSILPIFSSHLGTFSLFFPSFSSSPSLSLSLSSDLHGNMSLPLSDSLCFPISSLIVVTFSSILCLKLVFRHWFWLSHKVEIDSNCSFRCLISFPVCSIGVLSVQRFSNSSFCSFDLSTKLQFLWNHRTFRYFVFKPTFKANYPRFKLVLVILQHT